MLKIKRKLLNLVFRWDVWEYQMNKQVLRFGYVLTRLLLLQVLIYLLMVEKLQNKFNKYKLIMRPLTNSLVKGLINIAKNIMSIIDIVNDSDILIYFLSLIIALISYSLRFKIILLKISKSMYFNFKYLTTKNINPIIAQAPNEIYEGMDKEAGEPGINSNNKKTKDTNDPKIANVL